jgi:hypothetical protein
VAILTSVGSALCYNDDVPVLRCPMRLGEIDMQIERNLVSSRLGRACRPSRSSMWRFHRIKSRNSHS